MAVVVIEFDLRVVVGGIWYLSLIFKVNHADHGLYDEALPSLVRKHVVCKYDM